MEIARADGTDPSLFNPLKQWDGNGEKQHPFSHTCWGLNKTPFYMKTTPCMVQHTFMGNKWIETGK